MYPEQGGAADYAGGGGGGGGDLKSNVAYHLEGLIPLILILIIAFFLAVKFNVITTTTPVIGPVVNVFGGVIGTGTGPIELLIVGQSSAEVIDVLNANPDLVIYRIKSARELERNPLEQFAQYDVVMLDQSEQPDKVISRRLGDALNQWVKKGGSLIVVKDSGIRREGVGGNIAFDVVGWEGTIGDVVPVQCARVGQGQLACENKIFVRGKITRQVEDHPIMRGIEVAPPQEGAFFLLETFDLNPSGREIAYIREARGIDTYPAIVEARSLTGKSIYFNYNPGKTKTILENTLRYLVGQSI